MHKKRIIETMFNYIDKCMKYNPCLPGAWRAVHVKLKIVQIIEYLVVI